MQRERCAVDGVATNGAAADGPRTPAVQAQVEGYRAGHGATTLSVCTSSSMCTALQAEQIRACSTTCRSLRPWSLFARAKRTTCGTGWSSITPQKHGSWLNMVEIEIDVLRRQCLDRRIAEPERLVSEIAAWKRQRNAAGARIKWMFTTERTRAKLARLPGSKQ
jgi:hypothetical protein